VSHPPLARPAALLARSLVLLSLLAAAPAAAQEDSTTTAATPPTVRRALPRIVRVQPDSATVGTFIRVTIENLDSAVVTPADLHKLTLYLDGLPMDATPAMVRDGELGFRLRRSEAAREAWGTLLGRANGRGQEVTVGIGFPDEREISQPAGYPRVRLRLIAYKEKDFVFGAAGVLLMLIGFVGLALKTGIIRDRATDSVEASKRPYSLARFQMAVWFFTIFTSMMYIVMVLGEAEASLSSQALMLLGIGAATQLGGTLAERAGSEDSDASAGATTQGFFADLLMDGTGVNFHRFQMLVWTLTLAAMFLVQVYDTLTMPQFSESLLALMGISNGTYVTFKMWEKPTTSATEPTTAPQAPPPAGTPQRVNVGAGTQIVTTTATWANATEIAVMGSHFTPKTTVVLNQVTKPAEAVTVVSPEQLRVRVADGEAEPGEVVNLQVVNEDGTTANVQLT
jgi:hypothetical protein